jgi:type I restriction enzyme R subunit
MSGIDPIERVTQNRVLKLFTEELEYKYLGNWQDQDNSHIQDTILTQYLENRSYTPTQISRAIFQLKREASIGDRTLYEANQAVYEMIRYGVGIQEQGQREERVQLIDWDNPNNNLFGIAEEVTLKSNHERRPDLVLYVNGIALAVIELKRSSVGIGEGIRQAISNQSELFNKWFYTTVQWVVAGNDSEGLRYGAIGTEEKYFLAWKEDEFDNSRNKLDKYLLKLFEPTRFLELVKDFVLFDAGVKKLPRPHQYFGIKCAQEHVKRNEGGIIWHSQGSGKSIVMVLLAKWILENRPHARVCIITDRDELDKQIETVFQGAGESKIKRTRNGQDLMLSLQDPQFRLFCSLIHKFGRKDIDDFDAYIKELENSPPIVAGEVFVFVDECHRTQSGKLNRVMKAMLPIAVFIGFTGTPLLRQDKQTTMEVFGRYIHTYKFSEAVRDGVVLDLVYEARDIDQQLSNEDRVDQWFESKTQGLNNWQKDELRKKWATMQNVLSSKSRMDRVVDDITFDFATKARLSGARGNAILVASSILEACKYFVLFQSTEFKNRCAIVTSYNPNESDISKEDTGSNTETDKEFIYKTYTKLLQDVVTVGGKSKTEVYEDIAKRRFIKEPANMKILIVVDKLLTGFDAPPCTFLYIDKSMQDHGLFQAICRTNRLDGEDKQYGYIVGYKKLFDNIQDAINVYSNELDDPNDGTSPEILIKDRMAAGREKLDNALEAYHVIVEPVEHPKNTEDYIRYFCGNTEIETDLLRTEHLRQALYKCAAELLRSFASIADVLETAGYSVERVSRIRTVVEDARKTYEVIKKASGEYLDLKAYEADMRQLIDRYIKADEPRKISDFDDLPLLDLLAKLGMNKAVEEIEKIVGKDHAAVAETIENNVRTTIVKEQTSDPVFYTKISLALAEIIRARKEDAISYEEYLKKMAELARQLKAGSDSTLPTAISTSGMKALFHSLDNNEELALKVHFAVQNSKPDAFRNNPQKEKAVQKAIFDVVNDRNLTMKLFDVIVHQKEY